ncbi:MAG: hypothetical protein ACR2JE_05245 [Acidobacteriaceae bacterium]
MTTPEIPQLFTCEYVRICAKFNDGRRPSWTHWVPNKAVDDLFGITTNEQYQTAEHFADEKASSYLQGGICVLWEGTEEEEYIPADKIIEVSTSVEQRHLTIAEIMIREAHLHNPSCIKLIPSRKQPSLQQTVDALDEMLSGKATLNDFFAQLRMPQRSEPAANTLLRPINGGYASVSDEKHLDIRPLFPDDTLYHIVEIRRVQLLHGIA